MSSMYVCETPYSVAMCMGGMHTHIRICTKDVATQLRIILCDLGHSICMHTYNYICIHHKVYFVYRDGHVLGPMACIHVPCCNIHTCTCMCVCRIVLQMLFKCGLRDWR